MPVCHEHWDLCGQCLSAVQMTLGKRKTHLIREIDETERFLLEHGFDAFGGLIPPEVDSG